MQLKSKPYFNELSDTAWLIILQGMTYVLPLVVWPYLMKTLGAEGFGKISFANTLALVLCMIVDFGFNLTATKRIAQYRERDGEQEELNQIFSETLIAKLPLLALSGLCLFIVCTIPQYAPYRWINLLFFAMVIGNLFSFSWLYQGMGKIRIVSLINALAKVLILPLSFLFVHAPEDIYIAAMIQTVVYLAAGLIMIVDVYKRKWVRLQRVSLTAVHHALKDALPVFISNAMSTIYVMLFVLILGFYTAPEEVGCYAAAEKVMRVGCYLLLLPLLQSFYPRVSSLAITDRVRAFQLVDKLCIAMAIMMAVLWGVLYFCAEPLLFWLGHDYEGIDSLLHIFSFVPLFVSLGGICGQLGLLALGGEDEKKKYRNTYIAAAILAVVGILLLRNRLTAVYTSLLLLAIEIFVCLSMVWTFISMKQKK